MAILLYLICVYSLSGCATLAPKTNLDIFFPDSIQEVYYYHNTDMPGDWCEARVFVLDEKYTKETESLLEKESGWMKLPMQEEEYIVFVENCLRWASSHVPDFDFDYLKDPKCAGYWIYSGDYYTNKKDWPEYTWGQQELILYLAEYKQIIYLYNFE